jgi:hypothetical protein
MSVNKSTTYDLQVNHSVQFWCGQHKKPLMGTPTFDYAGDPPEVGVDSTWRVDSSDMWCPDDSQEFKDGDEFDCLDSWVTIVEGLHVWAPVPADEAAS